jgi:release factor glutamine methyltransferase
MRLRSILRCAITNRPALFAGAEGLDDYRIILPALPTLLAPGGVALIEIGHTQAQAVSALAQAQGFIARLHRDLGDRPRVLEISSAPPSSH